MIKATVEAWNRSGQGSSVPPEAPGIPVLPLSAGAAATCLAAFAALEDPSPQDRPPRRDRLPGPVAQAVRMLDDPEFRETAALSRSQRAGRKADPGSADRRRTLLRKLRGRYPEGVEAIRAAYGPRRNPEGQQFIIVSVYTHLIIITSGELQCLENPFD